MDVEDSLELLSPQFSNPLVRKYAVFRLQHAAREDLLLYLLQLVQALRYEHQEDSNPSGPLFDSDDTLGGVRVVSTGTPSPVVSPVVPLSPSKDVFDENATMDLATFLIDTACRDDVFANYLYWYLRVECGTKLQDSGVKEDVFYSPDIFRDVMKRVSTSLAKYSAKSRRSRAQILAQQAFVDRLVLIMKAVAREGGSKKKRVEFLQAHLNDSDSHGTQALAGTRQEGSGGSVVNFGHLDGLSLPLDPSVQVNAVLAEKATLFSSVLSPAKLTFLTTDNMEYLSIFKHGDDLRQDQLVIQIFSLMDRLLKKENLDLKLTTYQVLATSCTEGFVQFIESRPLRDVLDHETSIQFIQISHLKDNTIESQSEDMLCLLAGICTWSRM